MSYSTESHIDQKSYATKSRTDEMTFDEMSCTYRIDIPIGMALKILWPEIEHVISYSFYIIKNLNK